MKLKPFIGPMSGAVALHYRGSKQMIAVNIEYWKDGVKTNISSGTVYSELVYAFVSESGYASSVVRVDKPAELNMSGEMRLQQKVKVPLDESTLVWGLQG
jgi:hypothetical protein